MKDLNYFAENEQQAQQQFKSTRDRLFAPLVWLCARLGIGPDFVSLCGMLALVPFAYLVIAFPDQPLMVAIACSFLVLHVTLDGLDGPLARYCKLDNAAGAFVDMCCDHGGMVVVTIVLSVAGLIDGTIGNVYVITYTVAVVFISWLNQLGQPFKFVFRSKYIFYLLIFVQSVSPWAVLNGALLLFSAANLWICLVAFFRIRRILAAQDSDS